MKPGEIVEATVDDAVSAVETQAITDGDERTLHAFALSGVPGLVVGADWDVQHVIEAVRGAVALRWCNYLGHGLAIEQPNGACYVFQVQRPGAVAS